MICTTASAILTGSPHLRMGHSSLYDLKSLTQKKTTSQRNNYAPGIGRGMLPVVSCAQLSILGYWVVRTINTSTRTSVDVSLNRYRPRLTSTDSNIHSQCTLTKVSATATERGRSSPTRHFCTNTLCCCLPVLYIGELGQTDGFFSNSSSHRTVGTPREHALGTTRWPTHSPTP